MSVSWRLPVSALAPPGRPEKARCWRGDSAGMAALAGEQPKCRACSLLANARTAVGVATAVQFGIHVSDGQRIRSVLSGFENKPVPFC